MTGLSSSEHGLIVSDALGRKAYTTELIPRLSVSDRFASLDGTGRSGDIAVDAGGHLWISTDGDPAVLCLDTSGDILRSVPSDILPAAGGLAFDGSGTLWVSDPEGDMLYGLSITPEGP